MTTITNVTADGNSHPSESDETILFCVENYLFKKYLEANLERAQAKWRFLDRSELGDAICQSQYNVVILQSDDQEYEIIEIAARLKRIFRDNLRLIFLSVDHEIISYASSVFDECLIYPCSFDRVMSAIHDYKGIERKVLLVDDSKLVHRTLVEPLKKAGFDVYQAFDGQEGVDKANAIEPKVIICDVEMPKMNGYEVSRAIRNNNTISDAYIIMSSTLGTAADHQNGFNAGVDEYITKPVIIDDLIERLQKSFQKAISVRENILIIESNELLARNIQKSLLKSGFRAHAVGSVQSAINLLSKIRCDLILCEISPKDGSIIDFFNKFKTLPSAQQGDVVVLASKDNPAEMRMAKNAGAHDVISKPVNSENLNSLVERTIADRQSRLERSQLQKYVSKASLRMAVQKSIISGSGSSARADKRNGTILFSDIVDFTNRCERYTPNEVVGQVNTLFSHLTRVILEHDGDIDKFMGDACLAFWLDDKTNESGSKALTAVLSLRDALEEMNKTSDLLKNDPISIRIGINTGEVILCDIGAIEARIDLTIISDAVNLASRLESASKQYGVDNLVSEFTLSNTNRDFAARIIDRIQVKGKNEAVNCYELIGLHKNISSRQNELIQIYNSAFNKYIAGEFESACKLFIMSEMLESPKTNINLNPSRVFIDRCKLLTENRPKTWDGVWRMMNK